MTNTRSSIPQINPARLAPLSLVGAALLAFACQSAEPRDLGSSNALLSGTEESEPLTPQNFIGNWVGTALDPLELDENGDALPLSFGSGSSQVSLQIHGDGVHGDRFATLTFGDPEAPLDLVLTDSDGQIIQPVITPLFEGFGYALNPVILESELDYSTGSFGIGSNVFSLRDSILRLAFYTEQVFDAGCAEQTVLESTERCNCTDGGGTCFANVRSNMYLWLRQTPSGLVGMFQGHVHTPNARGALTSLGPVRFSPVE